MLLVESGFVSTAVLDSEAARESVSVGRVLCDELGRCCWTGVRDLSKFF